MRYAVATSSQGSRSLVTSLAKGTACFKRMSCFFFGISRTHRGKLGGAVELVSKFVLGLAQDSCAVELKIDFARSFVLAHVHSNEALVVVVASLCNHFLVELQSVRSACSAVFSNIHLFDPSSSSPRKSAALLTT